MPTVARRALVAVAALLSYFAIWLWLGTVEGWAFLGLFAAAPAVFLALVPRTMRLMLLFLGVLLVGTEYISDYGSGADNPLSIIPFFGLCVAGAAVLVEAIFRAVDLLDRRRQRLA
jgi:hypothetical protein